MKGISDQGQLMLIEVNFHSLVKERLAELLDDHDLVTPSIESAVASPYERQMFEVPAMHGGFSYWLEDDRIEPSLLVESWSRTVKGSGQLHRVTVDGVYLIEDELC